MTAHIIFHIMLHSGFIWKAIFVAYGRKIDTLPSMTYILIVLRYTVQNLLILVALNGLSVNCADIKNEYLNDNP